ncbi:MAG TPA: MbcA/ParS/Xre antitoxin family protein [Roseomonas sp.]
MERNPQAPLARVIAFAIEVWSDTERASHWLSRPHPLLDGRTPLSVATTEAGAQQVEAILGRLQHGSAV